MTDSERYFISESLRHARTLSLSDSTTYLRGMMMLIDEDVMPELRETIRTLVQCDAQLELIANPQLKLPLDGHGGKP